MIVKTSKILPMILVLSALIIVGYRYYQYMVIREFVLILNAPCDTSVEKCFISDSPSTDSLGFDSAPYKKVSILAKDAPECLEEHTCQSFTCGNTSKGCEVTYCTEDNLGDGEKCFEQTSTDVSTSTDELDQNNN